MFGIAPEELQEDLQEEGSEAGTAEGPQGRDTERKTIDLPKLTWKQKLIADGWRYIGGETDSTEYISVFMRGFVVMYVRGATGMYSTGKCRFGVLFDNSGNSYTQLGKAENRARRLYASVS